MFSKNILVKGKKIGKGKKPFLIAEVGINHQGKLKRALKMIEVAKWAGVDAVKFQTFKADEFISDKKEKYSYISRGKKVTETMYEMFKRYELPKSAWIKIKKKCEKLGIIFFSTPQNFTDLELLIKIGIPLIKVGSDDFNNLPMLEKFTNFNIPIIVSCGMSNKIEIQKTMSLLKRKKPKVILLLCTSEYPTPSENVNLMRLKSLQRMYPNLLLGFSDHTIGSLSACAALCMGACVFEKHFTLKNDDAGPDHWFSENPKNLKKWADDIKETYKVFGNKKLKPTKSENKMRNLARRSIVAQKDIKKNEKITVKNTCFKRPGDGMKPEDLKKIINFKAKKLIKKNEKIYLKHLRK